MSTQSLNGCEIIDAETNEPAFVLRENGDELFVRYDRTGNMKWIARPRVNERPVRSITINVSFDEWRLLHSGLQSLYGEHRRIIEAFEPDEQQIVRDYHNARQTELQTLMQHITR